MKTNTYLSVFLLASFAGSLTGCHQQEVVPKEEYFSIKLDGQYDLVSLISETAVDLDHNGILSQDIIAETHTITEPNPPLKSIERYFLELTTEINDFDSKIYHQKFILWAPNATVFLDSQGKYLYTDYGYANLLAKYRYDEEENTIDILGNIGSGEVLSVQYFRSTQVMKVRFTQDYYTTKWEILTINGTYKRRL